MTTKTPVARAVEVGVADELIAVWRAILQEFPSQWGEVTVAAQSTALLSLFLNLTVTELQRTDHPFIRERMRTVAGWLTLLADTPADQLDATAQFLADIPRRGMSRQ